MTTDSTIRVPGAEAQAQWHLDGIGLPCWCIRYARRDAPVETTISRPPAVDRTALGRLGTLKSAYVLPQWDADERKQAQRKGYAVKVMSQGGFRNG